MIPCQDRRVRDFYRFAPVSLIDALPPPPPKSESGIRRLLLRRTADEWKSTLGQFHLPLRITLYEIIWWDFIADHASPLSTTPPFCQYKALSRQRDKANATPTFPPEILYDALITIGYSTRMAAKKAYCKG